MGILEMVKQILDAVPEAINDLDWDGKNVLMVAAENRQIGVFDFLIQRKLPEYVFHDLDCQGNSVLHSAANLRPEQTWSIPDAALQMQWEIKWYEVCSVYQHKFLLLPLQLLTTRDYALF